MRHRGRQSPERRAAPGPLSSSLSRDPAARKGNLMQSAHPRRWAGAWPHRARAVHGHHGHLDHRRRPARDPRRPRLQRRTTSRGSSTPTSSPSAACCCSAAACPTCSAPRRVFTAGWAILAGGSLAAGLADTTGVEIAARAAQGAGAALIAPSALTLLMMLFGSNPKELMKAFADLRRRRTRRRHRRRVPRRRDHRVDLAGRGSSTSTSRSRSACWLAIPGAAARRPGPPRLDRHRRRAHRDRRPRADRARRRPRARGRLGLGRHARRHRRRARPAGRVRRHPGARGASR